MEPSSNPNLKQLYRLLDEYIHTEDPEEKKAKEQAFTQLFYEKCASFNQQELRRFADSLSPLPELKGKVEVLATQLDNDFLNLFADIHNLIIGHIGLTGQAGLYSVNRQFAKKMKEPLYSHTKAIFNEIQTIENPRWYFKIEALLSRLTTYGKWVRTLDFSLLMRESIPFNHMREEQKDDLNFLIANDEKPKLEAQDFKKIIALCPNLHSLTLYKNYRLSGKDLIDAFEGSQTLRRLNFVDCRYLDDQTLKKAFPEVEVNTLNLQDAYMLQFWMARGVKLRDFFSLDPTHPLRNLFTGYPPIGKLSQYRDNPFSGFDHFASSLPHLHYETAIRLLENRDQASKLALAKMNFMEFDALSPKQQNSVLSHADQFAGFLKTGQTLKELVKSEFDERGGIKRASDESSSDDESPPKRPRLQT